MLIRAAEREYRTWIVDSRRWAGYRPHPDDVIVASHPKCEVYALSKIDTLVHTVSTAHSLHGWALKQKKPDVHVVAVRPSESAVLSGKPPGSHKIEGIGLGFLPPQWKPDEVQDILTVSTDDAKAMARVLAREEAIFAGTSTGANVVAGGTVATIIVDSGLRYLSTDVFRSTS